MKIIYIIKFYFNYKFIFLVKCCCYKNKFIKKLKINVNVNYVNINLETLHKNGRIRLCFKE